MSTVNRYIFLFFLVIVSTNVLAQTEKVTDAIKSLVSIWEKNYYVSDTADGFISPSAAFLMLDSNREKLMTKDQLLLNVQKAEIENYRHDPGIGVNANYLENFNPGLGEDDDNLIYNRRIQAGFTWNILDNGFVENRLLASKEQNEIWLNQHAASSKVDKKSYTDKWNRIIYLFNSKKIDLLNERQTILKEMEKYSSELYLLKFITREKYIAILTRKTEVESMYRIYADYNLAFEKMSDSVLIQVESFPVFDINYDTIIKILSGKSMQNDSASILFADNLKIENSIWREINLNTSLKYNYYNLITDNPSSRQFMTFGLNFSMPLLVNHKQKKKLAEARAAYSKYVFEHSGEEFHREVLNDCYEYRYKLKQLDGFYQKKNLLEEKLRKYNALKDINDIDFNPVEALSVLDEYLSVQIEIVDLTQNLYLKFHRINSYFSNEFESDFTSEYKLPSGYELDDAITRSLYLWSSSIESNSDIFIREYLIYNKIDNAVISIKEDTAYISKLNRLIEELKNRKIGVEIMIGDNHLIESNDFTQAIEKKMKNVKTDLIQSLHLDIEPHTFADWDSNKESYLKKYLEMLQKARIWCDQKEISLTVSIPLHYPEDVTKEIFNYVDKVYFMAYENIKVEYIQRKISYYEEMKNKWVLAVSVKDFSNRPALEQHLLDLFQMSKCSSYAIHDFGRLIELDENNIEEKR